METPADASVELRKRSGRPRKDAPAPAYPFDPGACALTTFLDEMGLPDAGVSAETAVLRLPSLGKRPLASSALVDDPLRAAELPMERALPPPGQRRSEPVGAARRRLARRAGLSGGDHGVRVERGAERGFQAVAGTYETKDRLND